MTLAFGQDDFVIVERVETERKEGETGLISSSLTDERSTKTTIRNLHNFPIDVKMLDRLPVANHEDIIVTMLPATTKPTVTDLDDQRGILSWSVNLAAGAQTVIDFGYRVSWPKAMMISGID
ncbi:MAG: DUF4139 domain-containing protein [Ahrensia sp.]|nr:DUF4139 domain-containing protein [Ahrensia sp.]